MTTYVRFFVHFWFRLSCYGGLYTSYVSLAYRLTFVVTTVLELVEPPFSQWHARYVEYQIKVLAYASYLF